MLTLLTPTGSRSASFSLCERWMAEQDFNGDYEWIVVDDGLIPTVCTAGQKYIRRALSASKNTLAANLAAAVHHITGDKILIIEDDDWYAPHYVRTMAGFLDGADICGEVCSRYYNVRYRWTFKHQNRNHASLFQTGFRSCLIPTFTESLTTKELYIDVAFWKTARELSDIKHKMIPPCDISLGIKGMPGRRGIAFGHGPRPEGRGMDDPDGEILRGIVGNDAFDLYREFTE